MDLSIYEIIKKPVFSEKASRLASSLNKIALEVHRKANKRMIKEALEKLFAVKVDSVCTFIRKPKKKTFKRVTSFGKSRKIAIVTLAPGYSLNVGATEGAAQAQVAAE